MQVALWIAIALVVICILVIAVRTVVGWAVVSHVIELFKDVDAERETADRNDKDAEKEAVE